MSDKEAVPTTDTGVKEGAPPTPEAVQTGKGAVDAGSPPVKTDTGADGGTDGGEKTPKHADAKDRINKLWRENKIKEAKLVEKDRAIKDLEDKLASKETVPASRPKRGDFDSEDVYLDALEKYQDVRYDQRLREKERQTVAERQATMVAESWKPFNDAVMKMDSEQYPDADEAMRSDGITYSGLSREFVRTSAIGPQMVYHFFKNPEQADKIARMPLAEQSRVLLDLQAELVKSSDPKSKSNAPSPIVPLGGADFKIAKDLNEMTDAEFNAARREQMKRKKASVN